MDAREATQLVLEAGKSDELKAAFLGVAEVTTPMGELVNVADACGPGRESYERFFFDGQRATSRNFKVFIHEALATRGWRRAGFECTAEGVVIRYSGGLFNVAFSRMPLLAALFEFLIGIESYREVDEILGRMLSDAHDHAVVETAAKALSRRIYGYLSRHLPSAQNAAKFNRILAFLESRSRDRTFLMDDDTVLQFWTDHAVKEDGRAGDFRAFRTVLDAFVAFSRALELAADQAAVRRASAVGSDLEASEVDPDDLSSLADLCLASGSRRCLSWPRNRSIGSSSLPTAKRSRCGCCSNSAPCRGTCRYRCSGRRCSGEFKRALPRRSGPRAASEACMT
jgi:CRISPR/Cas system CSM-associated protein Csm2 small subunit